jgi:hypothetical protein
LILIAVVLVLIDTCKFDPTEKEKGYQCLVFRATYRNYRDELTHMDFCRSPVLGLCHDDRFDPTDCHPTVTAFLDSRLQKHGRDYGKLLRPWPCHASAHLLGDSQSVLFHPPSGPADPQMLTVPPTVPMVGLQPALYKRSAAAAAMVNQTVSSVAKPAETVAAATVPNALSPPARVTWVPAPAGSAYKMKAPSPPPSLAP